MESIPGLAQLSAGHVWMKYVALLLLLILAEGLTGSVLNTPGLAGGGLREILASIPETSDMSTVNFDLGRSYEINLDLMIRDLAIALVLCAAVIIAGRPLWTRALLIVYNAWLTFELILTTLIIVLSLWNPEGRAIQYLIDVATVWLFNILVFAAWYWVIDSERQAEAASGASLRLDFSFPQSGDTWGAWSGWKPGFLDYLFLAFNLSISLSPTDTPCLSTRAKVLLMVQVIISLVLIIMIVARAISII
jgi:hypothetical protein